MFNVKKALNRFEQDSIGMSRLSLKILSRGFNQKKLKESKKTLKRVLAVLKGLMVTVSVSVSVTSDSVQSSFDIWLWSSMFKWLNYNSNCHCKKFCSKWHIENHRRHLFTRSPLRTKTHTRLKISWKRRDAVSDNDITTFLALVSNLYIISFL